MAIRYPTSSLHAKDWDKLEQEVKEEEKNEKLEGDAALNKLFQQIYSDGTDEVKKAMMKTFVSHHIFCQSHLFSLFIFLWSGLTHISPHTRPPSIVSIVRGFELSQHSDVILVTFCSIM